MYSPSNIYISFTQSCLTLCKPMDCSPSGFSVHGILQARIHLILQGIFLTQGSNPGFSHCRQIFYHLSHQGSPKFTLRNIKIIWTCDTVLVFLSHIKKKKKLSSWRYIISLRAGHYFYKTCCLFLSGKNTIAYFIINKSGCITKYLLYTTYNS